MTDLFLMNQILETWTDIDQSEQHWGKPGASQERFGCWEQWICVDTYHRCVDEVTPLMDLSELMQHDLSATVQHLALGL